MSSTITNATDKPIKIVHIITGLSVGGAERMLQKLLSAMDKQVFENTVISLTDLGPVAVDIKALGIPVYALNMKRGIPNPLGLIKLLYRLKKDSPDIVQTWMYHADLLGGIAAKITSKAKLVWNIRHSNLDKKINKWSTRMTARLCAKLSTQLPDAIICNSQRAVEIHQQLGYQAEKLKFIGNGFDMDIFQPEVLAKSLLTNELSISSDSLLVGLMARYDPQKDHLNFISAAQVALFHQPNCHFILAGTGVDAENEELTDLITKTGFINHFHLLGERHDMPLIIAALDILCLSSSSGEGFPNVVGEAMASGVPCVVTNVGDAAQIVGATGKVVAIGNSHDLATAMIELLNMPSIQRLGLGKLARVRIGENYSLAAITKQYEMFYQGLINN